MVVVAAVSLAVAVVDVDVDMVVDTTTEVAVLPVLALRKRWHRGRHAKRPWQQQRPSKTRGGGCRRCRQLSAAAPPQNKRFFEYWLATEYGTRGVTTSNECWMFCCIRSVNWLRFRFLFVACCWHAASVLGWCSSWSESRRRTRSRRPHARVRACDRDRDRDRD